MALSERGVPAAFVLAKALRASSDLGSATTLPLRSPVDRLPLTPAVRSAALPVELAYWEADYARHDWDFGHLFKFPFSFSAISSASLEIGLLTLT